MKTTGIIILLVGLGLTLTTSLSFFTKEKVVDIGKLEINRDKPHYLQWSPFLGIGIMVVGGLLIWRGSSTKA